jgi:hypothetical protein
MNNIHSLQTARRHAIMLLDEKSRKPKITLGNCIKTSKNSGRAKAILIFISSLITVGTALIMATTISAAGTMGKIIETNVQPNDATARQAAFQLDLLANKAVIYGIPVVIAVALYVAFIFARMSKKITS